MKKSYISILLLFLVMILAISAASAAEEIDDSSDSDLQAVEEVPLEEAASDVDVVGATDDTDVVADPGDGNNFTSLDAKIKSADAICFIDKDYVKADGEEAITITESISIMAEGTNTFTIDANNNGEIFKINPGVSVFLKGIIFKNGNSDKGGAIYNEGKLTISGCTFTNNTASVAGGAIYSENNNLVVESSTFEKNSVTNGYSQNRGSQGAAIAVNGGDLKVVESTFIENQANPASWGVGGAIYTNNSAVSIRGSDFKKNKGFFGGALLFENITQKDCTIDDCTFEENQGLQGGAINIQSDAGAVTIDKCDFISNSVYSTGTGTTWSDGAMGGAIIAFDVDLTITNSKFDANTLESPNTSNCYGGVAYITGSLTMDNVNLTNNINKHGPAGAIYLKSTTGDSKITNCIFENNAASGNGGAIFFYTPDNSGTLTITDNTEFKQNEAGNTGGAILAHNGAVNISNVSFTNNVANVTGGAIQARGNAETTIEDSTFDGNKANDTANAIYSDGVLTLSGNTIEGDEVEIIANGEVTSQINVNILNNGTVETNDGTYTVTAIVSDDKNNSIADLDGIKFITNGAEVAAGYNATTKVYEGLLILPAPGIFTVNATYNEELTVKTATIKNFKGTFQDLQTRVNNSGGVLDLPYDFAYTPELGDDAYVTGITISEDLIINGNDTVISGEGLAKIFKVMNGTLTLNNVTICNGVSQNINNGVDNNGGAIYVAADASLVAENVAFINNTAIIDPDNYVYGQGGAIFAMGDVTIKEGSSFIDNFAQHGGAIYTYGNLDVNGALFMNNIAGTDEYYGIGGAILAGSDGQVTTINGSSFIENSANDSGAIRLSGKEANISSTVFASNEAKTSQGGAIYASGVDLTVNENSIFMNNTAYTEGGAIYATSNSSLVLSDSEFTNNTADAAGAISIDLSAAEITGTVFEENKANTGGAIRVVNIYGVGGATTIKESEFISNEATGNGGALFFVDDTYGLTISDNTNFTDNKAGNTGGAILVSFGQAEITGANFTGNDAAVNGSAAYIRDTGAADIKDSTFTNNGEANDYAIYNLGELDLDGNTVSNFIYNNGTVNTQLIVIILNGETQVNYANNDVVINATITNADKNQIDDDTFKFVISKDGSLVVDEVEAVYDAAAGYYKGIYTLPGIGTYKVNITSSKNDDLDVTVGYINNIVGTFTALDALIKDATTVNLTGDFSYDATIDGDFKKGIVIDHDLTINGNEYNISGEKLAKVFKVMSGTLTLNNVTICNGVSQNINNGVDNNGGAIYVEEGAALVVENVAFINNTAISHGGAIFSWGDVTVKEGSKFINNTAGTWGGAIYVQTNLNVTGATFTENTAGHVAGAISVSGDQISIKDSSFTKNKAVEMDSGAVKIANESATTIISSTDFIENSAATSAGALTAYGGNLVIKDNCKFINNTAVTSAGAIYTYGNVEIADSEFVNNNAADGGAIYYNINGNLTVTGSKFIDNTANYGGAIENEGFGILTASDCNFTNNTATVRGGAIISSGNTSVSDSVFADNKATDNSNAIYLYAPNTTLQLSNNEISGSDDAQILVKNGAQVISPLNVTILDNGTYNITTSSPYNITAVVTDLKGNLIVDDAFRFIVGDNIIDNIEINATTGVYTATFTPSETGSFVVSTNLEDTSSIETAVLNIFRTFSDLQALIEADTTGNIILKGDYTYNEEFDSALINGIVIDKAITIDGNGSTISGADAARIFQLNANNINIKNTTFINGYSNTSSAQTADWGGAIYSNGAYKGHVISDCKFYNNTAYNGGAIYLGGDASDIIGCEFEDNNATTSGGAVFINGLHDTIDDSTFNNNEANEFGGAVACSSDEQGAEISNSVFTSNIALNGGAVSMQNAAGTISGSNFTENLAENGGAIAVYGEAKITESNFTNNTADNYGGAVYVNGSAKLYITKSVMKNNTATVGSSIYSNGTIESTIVNATILDNKTWNDTGLGDIYVLNATLTDDMGNSIYDPNFRFTVDGTEIADAPLYNETTGLYTLGYYMDTAGLIEISTSYSAASLPVFTGALDIPLANVTEFTVFVSDILEDENATVWITLIGVNDEGLDSIVTVIVNNKEYAVPVVNGTGNITIENLTHGQYPVVAMFEDPNYNYEINSTVFYVKATTTIVIEGPTENVTYGEAVTINITVTTSDNIPFDGLITLGYYMTEFNVVINDGKGSYTFDADTYFLSKGEHEFIAVYDGNNDYNASESNRIKFNVTAKELTKDNVTVLQDGIAPENVTLTILSPVDGTYNVTVNGNTVQVEVKDCKGSAEIDAKYLNAGNNVANVTIDDENYALDMTVNITYRSNATFDVTFSGTYPNLEITIEGTNGTYTVYIDDTHKVNITVAEGKGTGSISDIAAGNYSVEVFYDINDEYYEGYKHYDDVIVAQATPNISVVAKEVTWPTAVNVTVTSDVSGTYTVKVGNKSREVTLEAGVAQNVTFEGLDANENGYAINVTYAETENYTAAVNDTEKVIVKKADAVFNATVTTPVVYPNNVTVTVNSTVAGKVTIDGKYVYDIGVGETKLDIPGLTVATYTEMEVLFEADNYNSVTKNITFEVVQGTPNIGVEVSVVVDTYPGAVTVFVTSDADGNYNITVGDETKLVTVANGIGKESFSNVGAGTQNATVTFLGDANYKVTTVEKEFTINKANATGVCQVKITQYPDDFEIFIRGTDGDYNASVDAEHFVEITVVNGNGTGNISGLAAGKYNLTVKYAENTNYNAKEFKVEFEIYKDYSYVELTPVNETVTYPGAVNITFTALHGEPIFNITDASGKEVSFTTVDNKIVLTGLAAGTYTVKALIKETENYTADYDEITFDVEKAAVVIKPKATGEFIVDGKVNVTFALPTDVTGTIIVTVDGVAAQELPTPVNGVYTFEFDEFNAGSHTFVVSLTNDANYTDAMGQTTFDVEKVNVTISIAPDNSVPNPESILIKVADNATGTILVEIPGYLTLQKYEIENGTYTLDLGPIPADDYEIFVTYMGDDKYNNASANATFTIVKLASPEVIVNITDTAIVGEKDVVVNITVGDNFANPGNVTVYVDGIPVQTVAIDEYGNATVTVPALENGTHTIGVKYNGNNYFNASDIVNKTVTVTKAASSVTIDPIDNVTYGNTVVIKYTIVNETDYVTVLVTDESGKSYERTVEDGVITVEGIIPAGKYTVSIHNGESGFYTESEANATFYVTEGPKIDIKVAENTTAPTFNITLPEDATGYVLVDVDGKQYYAPLVNGSASIQTAPLAGGNHTVKVTYTGDDKYAGFSNTTNMTIDSNVTADTALDVPASSENTPTFSVNLPSDATGFLTVDVDGKKYAAVVENGKASISVPGLSEGNHNVTVIYSGDAKYPTLTKDATVNVHIPVYKITQNKNINVVYSAKATYKVLITKDGKAVGAGESVTIKYNGKTYTVKTDSKGYATFKPTTKVKVKKYTITATYKGVTVKNTVKVKHLIKASNKKIKKSKKVNKIKVKTNKVNGKYLKGKKLTLKIKGKKVKAKINKKGVATFKLKKKVTKKLKAGKKYKYTVTYGKDKVTKKVKVKR